LSDTYDVPYNIDLRRSSSESNLSLEEQARRKIITLPKYSIAKDYINNVLGKPVSLLEQQYAAEQQAPTGVDQPVVSKITTEYKGKVAENIVYNISQPVVLAANSSYAYPISVVEDGEIIHFTVSFNDPLMTVKCILYDENNKPDTLCDDNPTQLTLLARGMTYHEANEIDNNNVSVDRSGIVHHVMPYVARHKHTYSQGYVDPVDYDIVAGTANDKFFIIEYAPLIPHPYKRLFFTIENKSQNNRLIHYVRVARYAYTDRYETKIVNTPASQVIDPRSLLNNPANIPMPLAQMSKVKLIG